MNIWNAERARSASGTSLHRRLVALGLAAGLLGVTGVAVGVYRHRTGSDDPRAETTRNALVFGIKFGHDGDLDSIQLASCIKVGDGGGRGGTRVGSDLYYYDTPRPVGAEGVTTLGSSYSVTEGGVTLTGVTKVLRGDVKSTTDTIDAVKLAALVNSPESGSTLGYAMSSADLPGFPCNQSVRPSTVRTLNSDGSLTAQQPLTAENVLGALQGGVAVVNYDRKTSRLDVLLGDGYQEKTSAT